jgi:RNA-directed DNA polymerase
VNTDVLVWPDRELAEAQVLRIQIKLHQWAIDDPDRRFDDLFEPSRLWWRH